MRCVPCSTEQSTFRGGEKGEKAPKRGQKKEVPAKGGGKKEKRTPENRSA